MYGKNGKFRDPPANVTLIGILNIQWYRFRFFAQVMPVIFSHVKMVDVASIWKELVSTNASARGITVDIDASVSVTTSAFPSTAR